MRQKFKVLNFLEMTFLVNFWGIRNYETRY